jgi:hypothetical protein
MQRETCGAVRWGQHVPFPKAGDSRAAGSQTLPLSMLDTGSQWACPIIAQLLNLMLQEGAGSGRQQARCRLPDPAPQHEQTLLVRMNEWSAPRLPFLAGSEPRRLLCR